MGRELKSNGGIFPPVVKFLEAGDTLKGVLVGSRNSGNAYGKQYEFEVIDGSAFIGRPDGTKNSRGHNNYAPVDVAPGEKVSLGTSKGGQLESKLDQAIVGEKVEITFVGPKLNPKSGRTYNEFKVIVLD